MSTRKEKFYGWLCCVDTNERLRWATFKEASACDQVRREHDPNMELGDIERNEMASFYHPNMDRWVYVEEN